MTFAILLPGFLDQIAETSTFPPLIAADADKDYQQKRGESGGGCHHNLTAIFNILNVTMSGTIRRLMLLRRSFASCPSPPLKTPVQKIKEGTKELASDGLKKASDLAKEGGKKVSELAEAGKKKVSDVVHKSEESVSEASKKASKDARENIECAKKTAKEDVDQAKKKLGKAKDEGDSLIQKTKDWVNERIKGQ